MCSHTIKERARTTVFSMSRAARRESRANSKPPGLAWIVAAALAGIVALAAPAAATDVAPFTVSLPTVTGPIASSSTSFPYIADGFDVEPPVPAGYVEQEYFFSGTGNLYEYTSTGIEVVAPCPTTVAEGMNCTGIPYTTRMLVKRPIDPRRFSGTVIVEALNPSANFDIAAIWDRSLNYIVRDGDVFVGWTSKSVTVNTLKTWNPTRYAPLNWTYAPFSPGNNSGVYDGITFDIAAQIGALFKQNGASSPLHGLNVKHVFEAGFSQDGSFTFTQADIFNALERMPNGGPVYDGYVPGGTTGPSDLNFGLTATGALPPGDPRVQMQPRDVPVIQTNTETEIALGVLFPDGLAYRRPDSDARNDRYRLWEVPGASHVSNDSDAAVITLQLNFAELEHITPAELPPNGCKHQQFIDGPTVGIAGVIDPNDYPFAYVANAAFADLTKWIDFNRPPPRAPRIETTSTTPASIELDQFGNALGGVRTPFVDVPITTFTPIDTVAHATLFSGFCILDGYNTLFSDSTLDSLYPNHLDYFGKVLGDSSRDVAQGFWLAPDAEAAVQKALKSNVP